MSAPTFEPVGAMSRRDLVIEHLAAAEYNEVIGYDLLAEALDGVDRSVVQMAVNAAKPTLEKEHRKAVVAVPNVGYRVVQPGEHMSLAVAHQKKSRRSLVRSLSKVANVELSKLTDGERTAVTLAATSLALQVDYIRRNDLRAARHEKALEAVTSTSDRTAEEVAELRARLERLEQRDG